MGSLGNRRLLAVPRANRPRVIVFVLPPGVVQDPLLFLAILVVFAAPPAWITVAWAYFPGYLFMSNGISRLRVSKQVEAQV
jgi:hypothetical protein